MPPTFVIADLWAQQAHHHVPHHDVPPRQRVAHAFVRVAGAVRRNPGGRPRRAPRPPRLSRSATLSGHAVQRTAQFRLTCGVQRRRPASETERRRTSADEVEAQPHSAATPGLTGTRRQAARQNRACGPGDLADDRRSRRRQPHDRVQRVLPDPTSCPPICVDASSPQQPTSATPALIRQGALARGTTGTVGVLLTDSLHLAFSDRGWLLRLHGGRPRPSSPRTGPGPHVADLVDARRPDPGPRPADGWGVGLQLRRRLDVAGPARAAAVPLVFVDQRPGGRCAER